MSLDLSIKYNVPISGMKFRERLQNTIEDILQLSQVVLIPKVFIDKQSGGKRENASFGYIEKRRNSYILFMEGYADDIIELSVDNPLQTEDFYLYVTMRSLPGSETKILLFFSAIIALAEHNDALILDDGGLLSAKEREYTTAELKYIIRNTMVYHDWNDALKVFNNAIFFNESIDSPIISIKDNIN